MRVRIQKRAVAAEGGGSSYIDGEVQNFTALPVTVGTPAVDSAYLVREAEGVWLINRKPAGIYVRTSNDGDSGDWTYAGAFPDVFSSANFGVYDSTDSSKLVKLDVSGVTAETTRTLGVQDSNGTIALTSQIPTRDSLGLDTDDTVAFANLSGTNTGDQDIPAGIAAYLVEQTLTDAATVTYDVANGVNAKWTIGGDRTLSIPTNTTDGMSGRVVITQDGTGEWALTLAAGWGLTSANLADVAAMTAGEIAVLSWTRLTSTTFASTLMFV